MHPGALGNQVVNMFACNAENLDLTPHVGKIYVEHIFSVDCHDVDVLLLELAKPPTH